MKNREEKNKSNNALLQEIYLNYRQYIYSLAFKYLRDEKLAEDIVQETIIVIREKIIKKDIKSCHKIASLIGYIVKGLCIDMMKKNNRMVYREIVDDEIKAEDSLLTRLVFNDAINKLPEKYKTVFMMRVLRDMPYPEIARDLDLSESAVRKRMERARGLLKGIWLGDDNE